MFPALFEAVCYKPDAAVGTRQAQRARASDSKQTIDLDDQRAIPEHG
jgi:hypothetical protein